MCIKDGSFIIGEVKQSLALFDSVDFEKAAEVAELIKPDVLLFSSLDKKPSKFVLSKINELKTRLKPLEVNVQWYPINSSVLKLNL